uniref:transposase n=1 Tax=Sorangium atrum TaxID=2995308 RepID=UPI00358DB4B0
MFTPEPKAEVLRLAKLGDRSIGQVATDLDLTETALRSWIRRAEGIRRTRAIAGRRGNGCEVVEACFQGFRCARSAGTPRGRYGGRRPAWGVVLPGHCPEVTPPRTPPEPLRLRWVGRVPVNPRAQGWRRSPSAR